jgi:hypothetical protein
METPLATRETLIELFQEAWRNIEHADKQFTYFKERWYGWNYWAKKQPEYESWKTKCDLSDEDVAAFKKYPLDHYNMEDGFNIYQAWRGGQLAKTMLRQEFSKIYRHIWFETDITVEELAKGLNVSRDALEKQAERQAWYKPRRRKEQPNV